MNKKELEQALREDRPLTDEEAMAYMFGDNVDLVKGLRFEILEDKE
jgi:hypothetical protein